MRPTGAISKDSLILILIKTVHGASRIGYCDCNNSSHREPMNYDARAQTDFVNGIGAKFDFVESHGLS